ncbi:hypothetical protein D3C71_2174050 [compost metagenome]
MIIFVQLNFNGNGYMEPTVKDRMSAGAGAVWRRRWRSAKMEGALEFGGRAPVGLLEGGAEMAVT